MVQGLISNFSILATCIFILIQVSKKSLMISRHSSKTKFIIGLAFGVVAIFMMFFGIRVSPTVFTDLRSLTIICASVMGGLYASVLTSLAISLGRIFLFGGVTTAAVISSISAVATGIGCGIIAFYVKDYRKKWGSSLLYAALLPAIVNYVLLGAKSLAVTPIFLAIFLPGGILIAYVIHYLDQLKSIFLMYESEVTKDYLTGLFNYRAFDSYFNGKFPQIVQRYEALSILFVDIDYFKRINDTYGHKAGDEVLKQFAATLSNASGNSDSVFRVGGEEFSVLLDGYNHAEAFQIAEKICEDVRVRNFYISNDASIRITASIGIATYPDISKENLLEFADNALYRAKKTGRNKVVSYSG